MPGTETMTKHSFLLYHSLISEESGVSLPDFSLPKPSVSFHSVFIAPSLANFLLVYYIISFGYSIMAMEILGKIKKYFMSIKHY